LNKVPIRYDFYRKIYIKMTIGAIMLVIILSVLTKKKKYNTNTLFTTLKTQKGMELIIQIIFHYNP